MEQFRERVLEGFAAAGGVMPNSGQNYVEDPAAYEAAGHTPEQAAQAAARSKAANEEARAEAHARNRQMMDKLTRPRVRMSKPRPGTLPPTGYSQHFSRYQDEQQRGRREAAKISKPWSLIERIFNRDLPARAREEALSKLVNRTWMEFPPNATMDDMLGTAPRAKQSRPTAAGSGPRVSVEAHRLHWKRWPRRCPTWRATCESCGTAAI